MKNRIRVLAYGTTLFAAAAAVPACSIFDAGSDDRRHPLASVQTGADGGDSQDLGVTRPAFQTKSSTQLERSVEACVGGGALTVTATMITTSPTTAPDASAPAAPPTPTQAAFLTSDFNAGDDIVDVQKLLFDGTPDSMRTGVRVDQISLEYLTALKNVGNVVGSRCASSLTTDVSMCACETDDKAKAMLARCLSAVANPTTPQFADLAKAFGAMCQQNRGGAIASMIASLAFAKVP